MRKIALCLLLLTSSAFSQDVAVTMDWSGVDRQIKKFRQGGLVLIDTLEFLLMAEVDESLLRTNDGRKKIQSLDIEPKTAVYLQIVYSLAGADTSKFRVIQKRQSLYARRRVLPNNVEVPLPDHAGKFIDLFSNPAARSRPRDNRKPQ